MDKTILLVDDEELFRERLAKAFSQRGFTVFTAGDFDEAMRVIGKQRPAMGVIDLKMPGRSGLELIAEARKIKPDMQLVVLTGYGSIATATEAVRLGALYYLPKPADVDDILGAFARNPELALDVDQDEFTAPSLARAEWEHINRVLTDCGGNISLAAKKLDLHRRTLQRKLQKYPPNK
ncbi:response regulator transcription factor [Thiovibrio frasassiensis]|jgi:two-component system response regulator RegA|uniref:Response regulator n=1 Tax=Thiovibrio frasassiensis TaxID=2984131 RepID=A0A9X4MG21_9BACT|nr:response regulator [Thiovibrio frasassiensis]MDG4476834.1 response regulator [Thiovibrio frasassiensis]